jgi:anti-sigma B factor antagonist
MSRQLRGAAVFAATVAVVNRVVALFERLSGEGRWVMRIIERRVGDVVVLDFVGAVAGGKAAGVVEQAVRRHRLACTATVIVNLARVRSVDLAGINALVESYRAMREAGVELRLAAVSRRIHDLLVITRLLTVFDTFDTVEEAIDGPIAAATRVPEPALSPWPLGMLKRVLGA